MTEISLSDTDPAFGVELGFLEAIARRCPDEVHVLMPFAEMLTEAGRYEEGLEVDITLSRLLPLDATVWYNLACSYALTGHTDHAFDTLDKALHRGYDDFRHLREDEDLDALREDPRFQQLLERGRVG